MKRAYREMPYGDSPQEFIDAMKAHERAEESDDSETTVGKFIAIVAVIVVCGALVSGLLTAAGDSPAVLLAGQLAIGAGIVLAVGVAIAVLIWIFWTLGFGGGLIAIGLLSAIIARATQRV